MSSRRWTKLAILVAATSFLLIASVRQCNVHLVNESVASLHQKAWDAKIQGNHLKSARLIGDMQVKAHPDTTKRILFMTYQATEYGLAGEYDRQWETLRKALRLSKAFGVDSLIQDVSLSYANVTEYCSRDTTDCGRLTLSGSQESSLMLLVIALVMVFVFGLWSGGYSGGSPPIKT